MVSAGHGPLGGLGPFSDLSARAGFVAYRRWERAREQRPLQACRQSPRPHPKRTGDSARPPLSAIAARPNPTRKRVASVRLCGARRTRDAPPVRARSRSTARRRALSCEVRSMNANRTRVLMIVRSGNRHADDRRRTREGAEGDVGREVPRCSSSSLTHCATPRGPRLCERHLDSCARRHCCCPSA